MRAPTREARGTATESPAAATREEQIPARRFPRARTLELVGAVAFWAYVAWPLLRSSRLIQDFDSFAYYAPNEAVSFAAIRAGRLAQWNPYIFGGVGHLANPSASFFNPLKLPFVTFDPWRAVELITALHLLMLCVGMVALAQRLRLRAPAGFVASVAVLGSGMVGIRSIQYAQILVIAWIPWVLAAIDLVLDNPKRPRRAVGWLALTTALLAVSGHPQVVYMSAALAAAWAVSRAWCRGTWRHLWHVGAGAVLGAALAAIQLLPTLRLLDGAATHANTTGDPGFVLHRRLLPTTLFGDVWSKRLDVLSGTGEAMTYVGAAVATLAVLGAVVLLRRRRERGGTIVLLATPLVAAWLSQGGRSPLYRAARSVVPLFGQARVPARWLVVVTIVAAVFAAWGIDAIVARAVDHRIVAAVAAVLLVAVLIVAVGPFDLPAGKTMAAWLLAATLVVGAAAVAAFGPVHLRVAAALGAAALVVVELGLMVPHGPLRQLAAPASIGRTRGAAVAFLERHPERIIAMTQDRLAEPLYLIQSLRPNVNASFAIRSVDGYDGGPQVRDTWMDAMEALTGKPFNPELTLRAQAELPLDPALYARFGVRWALVDTSAVPATSSVPGWTGPVVRSGALEVYDNPRYDGDAFVYHAMRPAGHRPGRRLRSFDDAQIETVALVSGGPSRRCSAPCERTSAPVRRPDPEHLGVTTDAGGGLLTVAEQYDPGWRVKVDGHDTDVVKVDGYMLGVRVPAGRHTVRFSYTAPGLRAGAVLSVLAALTVLVLLIDPRFRRGASSATQPRDRAP